MRRQSFRKEMGPSGFSLIELLTSLMVMSLLLGLLLSGLIYANTINKKAETNQKLFYTQRYIELYFQKQILRSEKIVFKNNRVYLQDLESPESYYNYYRYSSGFLRRYKVYKNGLTSIGSGGNSQFIDGISSFSMTLGANQEIVIKYSLVVDGSIYDRETTISHGRMVEFV
ncbi:prepilin-type N-terminal cleavage/methylation domain-containing protein [Acetobacterium carbinolicum]|uniref:prepilin-type N-terminal cleavage/methylation domain-containing protein n=1 Tax=Acetobacterium carbinolicum TaxID=52690 RepID=UPI0039C955A6